MSRREICLVQEHWKAGPSRIYKGLYYVIDHLAERGWDPNPNKYATARPAWRARGPSVKDLAPPQTRTYGSQSSLLLKVVGAPRPPPWSHGGHLETRDTMGFTLFVDAGWKLGRASYGCRSPGSGRWTWLRARPASSNSPASLRRAAGGPRCSSRAAFNGLKL